jgi:hypothetical protein
MNEPMREITTAYLVSTNGHGIILTTNKTKADSVIVNANKKKIPVKTVCITTNVGRIKAIGNNCVIRKLPDDGFKNPIQFRNKLIKEWHDCFSKISEKSRVSMGITWNKICCKYGIPECHYEDFSQWLLDYNEYVFKNDD